MTLLPNDMFSRRGGVSGGAARFGGAVLIALVFVSLALMVLSRLDHGAIRELRWRSLDVLAPTLGLMAVPVDYVRRTGRQILGYRDVLSELDRLREENKRLEGLQGRVDELERKFTQLSALTHAVAEPGLPFTSARVISTATGPFGQSLLINAGKQNGARSGHSVVSGDGLVGRLIETGEKAARVLLLTDVNSRVPVVVGKAGVRAILIGDNGTRPQLQYLAADAKVLEGDRVFTSGDGGVFPRGLKVGVVDDWDGAARVRLTARLGELEYVGVLHFETPMLEMAGGAVSPLAPRAKSGRRVPRHSPSLVR